MAEHEDLIADLREFGRELILRFERFERSIHALVADMREERRGVLEEVRIHRAESRAYFEELHRHAEEDSLRTKELIAESRAQRQALLHILDRLDNGGTAPAT